MKDVTQVMQEDGDKVIIILPKDMDTESITNAVKEIINKSGSRGAVILENMENKK